MYDAVPGDPRSQAELEEYALRRGRFVATQILKSAPTFQYPESLDKLWKSANNNA